MKKSSKLIIFSFLVLMSGAVERKPPSPPSIRPEHIFPLLSRIHFPPSVHRQIEQLEEARKERIHLQNITIMENSTQQMKPELTNSSTFAGSSSLPATRPPHSSYSVRPFRTFHGQSPLVPRNKIEQELMWINFYRARSPLGTAVSASYQNDRYQGQGGGLQTGSPMGSGPGRGGPNRGYPGNTAGSGYVHGPPQPSGGPQQQGYVPQGPNQLVQPGGGVYGGNQGEGPGQSIGSYNVPVQPGPEKPLVSSYGNPNIASGIEPPAQQNLAMSSYGQSGQTQTVPGQGAGPQIGEGQGYQAPRTGPPPAGGAGYVAGGPNQPSQPQPAPYGQPMNQGQPQPQRPGGGGGLGQGQPAAAYGGQSGQGQIVQAPSVKPGSAAGYGGTPNQPGQSGVPPEPGPGQAPYGATVPQNQYGQNGVEPGSTAGQVPYGPTTLSPSPYGPQQPGPLPHTTTSPYQQPPPAVRPTDNSTLELYESDYEDSAEGLSATGDDQGFGQSPYGISQVQANRYPTSVGQIPAPPPAGYQGPPAGASGPNPVPYQPPPPPMPPAQVPYQPNAAVGSSYKGPAAMGSMDQIPGTRQNAFLFCCPPRGAP